MSSHNNEFSFFNQDISNDFEYRAFLKNFPKSFDFDNLTKEMLKISLHYKPDTIMFKNTFYFYKAAIETYSNESHKDFAIFRHNLLHQIKDRLYDYFLEDTDSFDLKDLLFIRNKLIEYNEIAEHIFINLGGDDRLRYKNLLSFLYSVADEKREYFLNKCNVGSYHVGDYLVDNRDVNFKRLQLKFIDRRREEFNTLYGALFS